MDVRRARAFLAVSEDLCFGRAAVPLQVAQPPLSRLVRNIEEQLGSSSSSVAPQWSPSARAAPYASSPYEHWSCNLMSAVWRTVALI